MHAGYKQLKLYISPKTFNPKLYTYIYICQSETAVMAAKSPRFQYFFVDFKSREVEPARVESRVF